MRAGVCGEVPPPTGARVYVPARGPVASGRRARGKVHGMDGQTPRFGVRVLQRVGQCLAVSALFLWVAAVGMWIYAESTLDEYGPPFLARWALVVALAAGVFTINALGIAALYQQLRDEEQPVEVRS